MRGLVNDLLRGWIGAALTLLGHLLERRHVARWRAFEKLQKELRQRYGVDQGTRVRAFGVETQQAIDAYAEGASSAVSFALTSGSTAAPKRLAYSEQRVARVRWAFIDAFARCYAAMPIARKSIYVFSALGGDDSLTGMLMKEAKLPPLLSTLQAPYRVQGHPALRALRAEWGAAPLRLWVMALSNPGLLYATNPSTLSTFFDGLQADWAQTTALIRAWLDRPEAFSRELHRLSRRLLSVGSSERLKHIARSEEPLPFLECVPGVEAYICWDGGYVQPFLHRLRSALPEDRCRHIPMYSMSTETQQTVPHYMDGQVCFLPLAAGVLYEFIPEGERDAPASLVPPRALEEGGVYSMVVSDGYGLRRYQTEDLFTCAGFVGGVPDLRFSRRRGMQYSFTGEKLTGAQVGEALTGLREVHPGLAAAVHLSCIPSQPAEEAIPHYRLVIVGDPSIEHDPDGLAMDFDLRLRALNREYDDKRSSERLAGARCVRLSLEDYVKRVGGARHQDNWESQFKFLPLVPQVWEELEEPVEASA